MNKTIAFFMAAVLLCSCGTAYKQAGTVRLMQYNVGVFHKSGSNSLADIAAIIREYGADIVSLNELDSCNRRNPVYQLENLAKVLGGWDYRYAKAISYVGGAYGDGIVSSVPVLGSYAGHLPRFEGSENRAFALVETQDYVFISTHLCHEYESSRLGQAKIINDYVLSHYANSTKPVFLAGDLNAGREEACIKEFLEYWEPLTPDAPTYPSDGAREHIDYIMVLRNPGYSRVRPVKAGVCDKSRVADLSAASDHLPVFADVRIR